MMPKIPIVKLYQLFIGTMQNPEHFSNHLCKGLWMTVGMEIKNYDDTSKSYREYTLVCVSTDFPNECPIGTKIKLPEFIVTYYHPAIIIELPKLIYP
jgi:hypothetical protein